jgi:hypothetical protein
MANIAPMRDTSVHTWGSSGEAPGAERLVILHGHKRIDVRHVHDAIERSAAHTQRAGDDLKRERRPLAASASFGRSSSVEARLRP